MKNIKSAIYHYRYNIKCGNFSEPVTTYAKLAVNALEKQIPKKIDRKSADDLVTGCHRCGEINALWKSNGDKNCYCGNCGQKIDWGDI